MTPLMWIFAIAASLVVVAGLVVLFILLFAVDAEPDFWEHDDRFGSGGEH